MPGWLKMIKLTSLDAGQTWEVVVQPVQWRWCPQPRCRTGDCSLLSSPQRPPLGPSCYHGLQTTSSLTVYLGTWWLHKLWKRLLWPCRKLLNYERLTVCFFFNSTVKSLFIKIISGNKNNMGFFIIQHNDMR